ncbi:follistatin-related protein 1-like [Clytia hemisphaerica]|uniref:Follistatin-related protein 1 n=1 Tax=Clytia hemisphaerica TaxID=252671 RepID=A0A7M5V887_9CNID|eukprot:TCONS_00005129-protein
MKAQIVILSSLLVLPILFAAKDKVTCDNIFCAEGQECVEKKTGAVCECMEKCESGYQPVCGSNGTLMTTFDNRCELFRQSCLLENSHDKSIKFVAPTTCEKALEIEKEETKSIKKSSKPKPVVCKQKERNNLREAIITFIKARVEENVETVSYKGLLFKYFHMFDADEDQMLDTMEFVKMVEKDMAESELKFKDPTSNPLLRGLCLSELIAITDVNSNYKLEFEEFHKCLDPTFKPPHQRCELNGKIYEDGNKVPFNCNTCECACGHWVCTRFNCNDNSSRNKFRKF